MDQSKFIEQMQNCKYICNFVDMPKRFQAPKHIFWDWNIEKQVPHFENFAKYLNFAHKNSVQNGSYAFPNELMRFRNEAKPIRVEIKKHFKNAVTI